MAAIDWDVLAGEMTGWRRHLHRFPELAYQEHKTADFIADQLSRIGLPIHRGLAGTGVVATLKKGDSDRRIGLRADMDALPIMEANEFEHVSRHHGVMHACGHDGHSAMLLGAAAALTRAGNFNGTVDFIFQPAEEGAAGGRQMVADGLFELFPAQAVYGLHNKPGLPTGDIHTCVGPIMAAVDTFEIIIEGTGGHGAIPHRSVDPVVIAAEAVLAFQTLVSRVTDPQQPTVLTVARIAGGEALNVIPQTVALAGGVRSFHAAARDAIETGMRRILEGLCHAHRARFDLDFRAGYPATVNSPAETEAAVRAATRLLGAARVEDKAVPWTASEDFAFLLQARPGCYVWLGNGDGEGNCMVHNPGYDFNDTALVTGARYWQTLVEQELAAA